MTEALLPAVGDFWQTSVLLLAFTDDDPPALLERVRGDDGQHAINGSFDSVEDAIELQRLLNEPSGHLECTCFRYVDGFSYQHASFGERKGPCDLDWRAIGTDWNAEDVLVEVSCTEEAGVLKGTNPVKKNR